jgi:hypothetical protein
MAFGEHRANALSKFDPSGKICIVAMQSAYVGLLGKLRESNGSGS